MKNCIHCGDTQKCHFCKGTGKTFEGRGNFNCSHCNGTGICRFCQGSATRPVSIRGGSQPVSPPQGFQGFQSQTNQPPTQSQNSEEDWYKKFQTMSSEEILDYFMREMSGGKFRKKMVGFGLKQLVKYGSSDGKSILSINPLLWEKLLTGTIKEQMACAEMIGYMGQGASGMVKQVAFLLQHENRLVRESAFNSLSSMKNLAATVEDDISDWIERESDAKLKKQGSKLLKSLSRIDNDTKELLILEEKEKRELLESLKDQESGSRIIDASQLGDSATDLSQYKNTFFMSHTTSDFPWVEKAVKEISTWDGCYCWTCERDIPPGADWLMEIYKALDTCNWYILFWSDKAAESKWTNEEMREAKKQNVEKGIPKVSIINLGKGEYPRIFLRNQSAMVTNQEELAEYLRNLKTQMNL